jgi:hypothetical protein
MAGWHPDSEWFWLGDRQGPNGTPFALEAVRLRRFDWPLALRYARAAFDSNRPAWFSWFESFRHSPP